ncbi:haloacid dehalogenase type II [Sneathiella aquimaris]|uniref:haloacid dehalogenase type II n=1 Tax=Sneathiella aquimaris TaxID=2599305 RepID=UPI00146CDA96|nr:haloacid dehalogenase type II [Sneathiella aquimaris]
MTKPTQALCFDVFGTVTDWYGSILKEAQSLPQTRQLNIPWDAFILKWRRDGYLASLKKIVAGEMDLMATAEINKRKLLELLQEYDIQGLSPGEIDHFNLSWNRLEAWEDVVAGLHQLKEDFLIMPFSNGDYRCLLDISKRNNLPWDGIISADFFKKIKPDPTIYKEAIDLLQMAPENVMMVACHAHDLNAAKKAGMKTAYVNRPLEFGGHDAADAVKAAYDIEATDFVDLARQLKETKL